MEPIYLDHKATTPVAPEVREAIACSRVKVAALLGGGREGSP